MRKPFISRVFSIWGRRPENGRHDEVATGTVVAEAPEPEVAHEPEGSLAGRFYRQGKELFTILKDGTNVLVRSDKTAIPWYEPRSVVLDHLARHGLAKPASSNSGFWYDAGRVPIKEHLEVQNKKPPGSVKHWVD